MQCNPLFSQKTRSAFVFAVTLSIVLIFFWGGGFELASKKRVQDRVFKKCA